MSARSFEFIKPGDLVWIMVPGIQSGMIGLAIKRSMRKNGRSHAWAVLVGGNVNHYVDYLLSLLDGCEYTER